MTDGAPPALPRHTLSVLVENTPGVLSRITALFSRRGFNIDSVTEGRTEHPAFSRLTLVVHAEPRPWSRSPNRSASSSTYSK